MCVLWHGIPCQTTTRKSGYMGSYYSSCLSIPFIYFGGLALDLQMLDVRGRAWRRVEKERLLEAIVKALEAQRRDLPGLDCILEKG